MRPQGLQRLVRGATALQFAVTAILLAASLATFLTYREQARDGDRTRELLVALERARGDVLSAETGLRGFVLTRDDAFLEPYRQEAPRMRATLRRLGADLDGRERLSVVRAGDIAEEWRRAFAEPILADLRAGTGRREARAQRLVDSGAGKRRIDAVRGLLAGASAAERRRVEDAADRLDARGRLGLGVLAGLFAVAIGVAVLLRRRLEHEVVGPVADLADAAAAVGEGELDRRVEPAGVREVQVAGRAFNDMAGRVEDTVVRLHELDELRAGFVSTVSHELRNPVQTIQGYVDELLDAGDDPTTGVQREALDVIARNAGLLEELIDDLLLLGRIDAGRLQLDRAEVDVGAVLRELCDEMAPITRGRDVGVDLELQASGPVLGDRRRLRQTFANLLSNAVKFSPAEGRITVAARAEDGMVVVEVADEGPGIPAEEIGRITERFFRASTARGIRGTGLGLTISRELVELHGGRLSVRSELGRGSTFRVQLPLGGR